MKHKSINQKDEQKYLHEPVWNWTDSYSSGVYKINNNGSVEHVQLQCSQTQTNQAQKKVTNLLEKGTNLEEEEDTTEEGFGEMLRSKSGSKDIRIIHIIILISLLLLLGIWLI